MAVPWALVQTLGLFILPLVYRYIKSIYTRSKTTQPPVPCPRPIKRLLDFLTLSAVICFALSATYFQPENVFTSTNSRLLQTPTDVLFNRIERLREPTPTDEILRSRLASKDARLLYAAYGPRPLVECTWCRLDDPNTFMMYHLPAMVAPHLLHLGVIGVATSSAFSRYGGNWRTLATLFALGIFAVEVWFKCVSRSDMDANMTARDEQAVVWTHWRMRVFRTVGMAVVDSLLGLVIWLSATRRWNIGWEEERIVEIQKLLLNMGSYLHAGNYLKQTVLRDDELRAKYVAWWRREDALGKELMLEDEVALARERLPSRINMDKLTSEAEEKSAGLISIIKELMGNEGGQGQA